MKSSNTKNRIIFLDTLRAFAILNMIQGHTVDVTLASYYRNPESLSYFIWNFNRGITAPIFLFTAGAVFSYIFERQKNSFYRNPRLAKGIKRAIFLIFIGYLIRSPSSNPFAISNISEAQWNQFFAIDVLQLIGFGLILIIFLFFLYEKTKVNKYLLFIFSTFLTLILTSFFEVIEWKSYIHPALAAYLYSGSGSIFPLFPHLSCMLSGSILGIYIAGNSDVIKRKKLIFNLLALGLLLIAYYFSLDYLHHRLNNPVNFFSKLVNITFFRIGAVLILVSIIIVISSKIKSLPSVITILGRNSLLVYVVHLFLLYGSAWNKGLIEIYDKKFTFEGSTVAAILLIIIMTLMAYSFEFLSLKRSHNLKQV